MRGRVVLNIGWARAGSTALRQNFLSRHPDIVVAWRGQPEQDGPAALTLQTVKTADEDTFRRRLPALRDSWAVYLDRTEAVVCLSDEELSIGLPAGTRPVELAARCALLFPDAPILAVVRHQIDALRSFYALAQRVSFGTRMSFPAWLDRHFLKPADGAGFAYLFAYAGTLKAYGAGRPRSNLLVLDHARLRADADAAYSEIARWMEISEAVGGTFPKAVVNASPPNRRPWPVDRAAAIREIYAADNQVLSTEFKVDFDPMPPHGPADSHAV